MIVEFRKNNLAGRHRRGRHLKKGFIQGRPLTGIARARPNQRVAKDFHSRITARRASHHQLSIKTRITAARRRLMQLHRQHIATTAEGSRRHRETQKILSIIRRREGQRLARHHINQSIARALDTIEVSNHPVIALETQSSRRDRRIHRKREGMTEINGSVPVDRIAKRQDRGFVILAIPQLSRSFHPRRIIKIRMFPMRGIITRLPHHHVASP